MDRRAFLRLVGIGLVAGPEAIAEAMKPQIFYSIPASLGTTIAYDSIQIPMRYMYGRVRLSAQMMREASPSGYGFAASLEREMASLRREMTRQVTRQVYA